MATIIRVKRHRQEDPLDALVLACKRKKTEESGEDTENESGSIKTVLNFSGTVDDKDDSNAAKTATSFKGHVPDIKAKMREDRKNQSEQNRFKVVSCLRAAGSDIYPKTEEEQNKVYTIVDVDVEAKGSNLAQDYVYDLYSCVHEPDDLNQLYVDNLLSVHPVAFDMEYRCGEDYYQEDMDGEDEDSNEENNWRNEYPDSDTERSVNEDDMRLAAQLHGCGLDDGYDLSSDDGEERYLNYEEEERDSNMAGDSYARYKRRMKQWMHREGSEEDENDEDDDEDGRLENGLA